MKHIVVLVTLLSLLACKSLDPNDRGSFSISDRKVIVVGCEQLKQEIDEHNRKNPNQQLVADC